MELYLIRHLPTTWNKEGRLQGRKDIPIKKVDQKTSKRINKTKKRLNKVPITKCFSSPLKRTVSTAKEYGFQTPTTDNRVIEFDFGKYEGRPKSEMLADISSIWYDNVEKLKLGEQFDEFKMRVDAFIDEKKSLENVLLFSHGFVSRYILAQYRYNDIDRLNHIEIPNNHLTRVNI
ncbi:histidine phosphatase family protein [Fodinibius salsisoli]|uniref:Histidine phosphatase family protein n=1 Tax=Fodinibius salsisoli TaxID=2820877 RepID=A0ABT3PTF3_9BACT|nr:histidine phosphatase family protein [Fodinibius salsisoli]MCW9709135.1 histidine phosphatase family protein [Fodinibius salsisoli]